MNRKVKEIVNKIKNKMNICSVIVIVILVLLISLQIIASLYQLYLRNTTITVTCPEEGNIWYSKGFHTVKWMAPDFTTHVKIELYKGDTRIELVVDITKNDGDYSGTFMLDYVPAWNYRIKIIDCNNSEIFGFSDYFEYNLYWEPPTNTTTK